MTGSKNRFLQFFYSGKTTKQRLLRLTLALSMIFKFVDGLIELVGGIAFAALDRGTIVDIFTRILEKELVFRISDETIEKWVDSLSHMLSTNVYTVICIILIGNGVVKMVIAIGVLLENHSVYVFSLIILIASLIYQIWQTVIHPSWFLFSMDLLDLIVILMIVREYLRLRQARRLH